MFNLLRRQKVNHPQVQGLFHFRNGRQFNAGAESFVYIPETQLPLIKHDAAGIPYSSLKVLQPAPVYVTKQVGIVGVGGLQTGQFILQPLVDLSAAPAVNQ